jgi:D-amino-acid oxidase
MARRVIVVGAGVVGLSCAVRLLEAGHRVDVVARDLPLETTSAVAGGLWYPYRAHPQDRVTGWAATTYAVFDAVADTDPESGVRMVRGTEVLHAPQAEPWWRSAVPDLTRTRDVPRGWAEGWTFTAPLVDMSVYLPWLVGRVEDLGGTVTRLNLSALPEVDGLVVNCSGLGARLLGADRTVVPVRGQVAYVEQVGVERWWLDAGGPTYVLPRGRDIVVGGTDVEGEWSRTPSPQTAEDLLRRATALVPELGRAAVLRHKVGLRPVRPSVRLERVGDVVHCYGHGGAGVTLSWGVAEEVAALVDRDPA